MSHTPVQCTAPQPLARSCPVNCGSPCSPSPTECPACPAMTSSQWSEVPTQSASLSPLPCSLHSCQPGLPAISPTQKACSCLRTLAPAGCSLHLIFLPLDIARAQTLTSFKTLLICHLSEVNQDTPNYTYHQPPVPPHTHPYSWSPLLSFAFPFFFLT